MNLLFFLFALIRLSTLYTGAPKQIDCYNGHLYSLTTSALFVDTIPVIESGKVLLHLYIKEDSIEILSRRFGDPYTEVEVYDSGFHFVYAMDGIKNAKYVEQGKDFKLFGTNFFSALVDKDGNSFKFYITNAHVLCDTLIMGWNEFSDTLLVLKPEFSGDTVSMDTVLIENNINPPRDIKLYGSGAYILTIDNRIYTLYCDGQCSLRRLYYSLNTDFQYINPEDTSRVWLSDFENTYIFSTKFRDSLSLVSTLKGISVKSIKSEGNVLYLLSSDGEIFKYNEGSVNQIYSSLSGVELLYARHDTIFGVKGGCPFGTVVRNPFVLSIYPMDSIFKVRYFDVSDGRLFYLTEEGQIFDVTSERVIADSVSADFLLMGNKLYYSRGDSVKEYDINAESSVMQRGFPGERVCYIKNIGTDILVFTRDTSMHYLYIHRLDSLLNERLFYVIGNGQAFLTMYKPAISGSILYVPYVIQGTGEYRVSRINLSFDSIEVEFTGYGLPAEVVPINEDSIYVLEIPYGMNDLRIVLVDFNSNESYISDFVGTGFGSAILDGNLLFVSSSGRVDVYDTEYSGKLGDKLVSLAFNVIANNRVSLYSVFHSSVNARLTLFNPAGRRLYTKYVYLQPGYNSVVIHGTETSGLYFLRVNLLDMRLEYTYKLLYIK